VSLVATVFDAWVRLRFSGEGRPPDALAAESLSPDDLAAAFPSGGPPRNLLPPGLEERPRPWAGDPDSPTAETDRGVFALYERAAMWAAALELDVEHSRPRVPDHTLLTTYGFVRTQLGIRLGVIHYVRPLTAFRLTLPRPIELAGWRFPVVIRPRLSLNDSGETPTDGNCWISYPTESGRANGLLVPSHALRPKKADVGEKVAVGVARQLGSGELVRRSDKMDAAVVDVASPTWRGECSAPPSSVIGFKPVRIIIGRGLYLDARVDEIRGFVSGEWSGRPGVDEPSVAAEMLLSRSLQRGDSGCLIVDREFGDFGPGLPYLMYLGRERIKKTTYGRGLFLAQPALIWDLQFAWRYRT
jgi:hypothetical protein